MNLRKAASSLQLASELSQNQLIEFIRRQAPDYWRAYDWGAWRSRWLASPRFILTRLPLADVRQPILNTQAATTEKYAKTKPEDYLPIVIDHNRRGIGAIADPSTGQGHGEILPYAVVDGKHRIEAARARGDSHIMAYIGLELVPYFNELASKAKSK